jgi:hypothetical protein
MDILVNEQELIDWVDRTPVDLREVVFEHFKEIRDNLEKRVAMYNMALLRLDLLRMEREHGVAKAVPLLQDEPPTDGTYTRCVNCEAGGDRSEKPCQLRTDTGIREGWYCDPCYVDWKNTP